MTTNIVLIFALNGPFFSSCIWQQALVRYVIFVGGARLSYLVPTENCYFSQSLRQTQIIILEILNVLLWL